tara:strand:+ start:14948 stop:17563 length:2616 start_codon:yes stop_codon:yes gene_type:complete
MANIHYLRDNGSVLIANGYRIVPIKRGCKHPKGLSGWQDTVADLNQLGQWISGGFEGVGIIAKDNPAIDIDILDKETSRIMVDKVKAKFSGSLIRVGRSPKSLLPYRTDKPFKKVRSKTYEDDSGNQHAVEILGDGQQYVAYAEHPDTLEPYTWFTEDLQDSQGIIDMPSDSLPTINIEDARLVCQWFEEIAEEKVKHNGWILVKGGQGGIETEEEEDEPLEEPELVDFSNLRPRLNLTDAEIKRALEHVSSDDYDMWIKVGMALWHECEGSEDGFTYWADWSEKSNNYSGERSCRDKWRGFKTRRRGRTITFASVLHYARDSRMKTNPLGEFKERYVYVADGDGVHDLGGLGHDKPLALKEFKNMTANILSTIQVPAPLANNPDRTVSKQVATHTLWLKDADRKTARGFEYEPSLKSMFKDAEGKAYINHFHMPKFVNPCKTIVTNGVTKLDEACCNELLATFFRHMEYIIPIEAEREWFYSWMAYNIQKPSERSKVTPLLIATDHGTGRGWIVKLMELLLGRWNCRKTKMSTLNGDSGAGQFQEFMNESLLCCIEEVKDSDKRYGVSDAIRDYLTEDTLEINVKYGAMKTKPVYTNFFWMSNHADAVVLTKEDRRINVFRTEGLPKGLEYYERLYAWLEDKKASEEGRVSNTTDIAVDSSTPNFTFGADGEPNNNFTDLPSDGEDTIEAIYDRGGLKVSSGVACLWHWLNQRDLTGFNNKRSMDNPTRRAMIENNMSPLEMLFRNVLANPPYVIMTQKEIHIHLKKGGGNDDPNDETIDLTVFHGKENGQLGKLIQQNLQKQEQVKVTPKRVNKTDKMEENPMDQEDQAMKPFTVRCWGFERGRIFSILEIREIYENRNCQSRIDENDS